MKRGQFLLSCCASTLLAACWGGGGSDSNGGGFSQPATHPLNDTGITLCGDYAFAAVSPQHNNNLDCADQATVPSATSNGAEYPEDGGDLIPAGQDAFFGRDVTRDSDTDGYKGFSFTKLGSNGAELIVQDVIWNDSGSEGLGSKWSCVRDNVTDLVWEVKTDNLIADLRDKDWTYTWYDSNDLNNGGNAGFPDMFGSVGSSNCFNSYRCDTEKYVQDVNNISLCGSRNWRLPTAEELKTLRHLGASSPAIVTAYFPNTESRDYWTSASRANASASAWAVDFNDGSTGFSAKTAEFSVRLVRDAE